MASIAIHDYDPYTHQEQEIAGQDGTRHLARAWFDILDPTTAQTLATYGKGHCAGTAAVTRNRFGSGSVYYVGTESSSPSFYSGLAASIAQETGIAQFKGLPESVESAVREEPGARIIFLLNHTEKAQTVLLNRQYQNALTGKCEPAKLELPGFDVKVLTSP